MILLALRFLLAPVLVAAASLAARRWGDRAGGYIAALPFVAGPLLLVVTLEHGIRFGAQTALSALSGITALAVFAVGYAHLARAFRWPVALPLGWSLYMMSAAALRPLETGVVARLAGALVSLWLAKALLPASQVATESVSDRQKPSWDLVARMGSAAVMVGSIATLSQALGPAWSGLLTPFPISTTILVAFAHAQDGHKAVARMLEGFIPALAGLTFFFGVVAVGLPALGLAGGFAVAFATAMGTQALLFRIKPSRG